MKRGAVSLVQSGVLAVLVAAGALGADKGGPLTVRLTLDSGEVLQGSARWKKDGLEVDTPTGPRRVPFRRLASVEEIDPDTPPPEAERPLDRATYEDRAAALAKKTDEPRALAHHWDVLAEWARKHGLDAEARSACEHAASLDPEDQDAEKGLGKAKDTDGTWTDARAVYAKKKAAAGTTPAALFELGRFAAKCGFDQEALLAIEPVNKLNPYDKSLLSYLRPITDRRKLLVPLAFPLKGRWRASQDPTHHHESKTFAVYAIDFYGDKDGQAWKGDGKALEDHYAWGQPVHACADGYVCSVLEGHADNPVGKVPPGDLTYMNNSISIVHSGDEVAWYLHLQKGSIRFKVNDQVKKGDVVGLIGNSGASYQPHLHFTICVPTSRTVNVQMLSVPWRMDDWNLVTDDGTRVHMKRARVLEGETIESD
jgi:hypothetical protein